MTTLAGAAGLAATSAEAAPPPARRTEWVETPDIALFVRDWGVGKPVVLLNAWSFSCDAWQYQMTPLVAQGLRCVTFDRRGHGRTGDPGRGYDFDTLADDVGRVLDALDLRDVTLVGYSMGCAEAVRYLTRH